MKIKYILSFCTIALLTRCSKEYFPPEHQNIEEMNQMILKEMEKDSIPSMAACIVKNDQIVWQNYYGYHDIENQIPPTNKTIYRDQ